MSVKPQGKKKTTGEAKCPHWKIFIIPNKGEEHRLGLLQAVVTREERLERSGHSGEDFE